MSLLVMARSGVEGQFGVQDKLFAGTHYTSSELIFIQADGHELTRCLKICGRPFVKPIMKFYDTDMLHILGNWNLD
jgi:hypothetical protein